MLSCQLGLNHDTPLVHAVVPLMLGWEQSAPTDKLCRDTQQRLGAVTSSSKILERLEAATQSQVHLGVPTVYL